MAKRLTDRSFQLCGAAPAPDPQLDTARQVLCERGYSSRVGMDDEFVRLYHDHHAAHAAAAHAAVAEAKLAGVDDPGELFETGGRAFLHGSWLRRDLALLFSSGDGPRDFIPVRQHLRDAWMHRNARLFHLDITPEGRLYSASLASLIGRGGYEVAAAADFRQAQGMIDAVLGYARLLIADRPLAPARPVRRDYIGLPGGSDWG
jgi:hypothetical protein